MNLWAVFPASILHIKGILYLPYLAISLYLYVCYALIKEPGFRLMLSVFLMLTLIASITLILSMGPGIGKIIPPALLLSVMLMPLLLFGLCIIKKESTGIRTLGIATAAGWVHSIGWVVWFFVVAGS